MSPQNRGSPLGSRLPAGVRPLPPPRFGGRPAISQRIPPLPPRMPSPPRMSSPSRMPSPPWMRRIPPINPMFGPGDPRQRIPPLQPPRIPPLQPPRIPPLQPPRPVTGGMSRLNGVPPLFPGGPRARGLAPIVPPMGPRGPLMRPWPRRMMPPMRPMRYNAGNGSLKSKPTRNAKKLNNRTVGISLYSPVYSDCLNSCFLSLTCTTLFNRASSSWRKS